MAVVGERTYGTESPTQRKRVQAARILSRPPTAIKYARAAFLCELPNGSVRRSHALVGKVGFWDGDCETGCGTSKSRRRSHALGLSAPSRIRTSLLKMAGESSAVAFRRRPLLRFDAVLSPLGRSAVTKTTSEAAPGEFFNRLGRF